MNNREFLSELSSGMGISIKDTQKMMNDFIEESACLLNESKDVTIYGFGTFELKKRKERIIVNPSSGKKMLVPPKLSLNFKISPKLKNQFTQE